MTVVTQGMFRKPTYEEVINYVESGGGKLKLPNRRAMDILQSFEMGQLQDNLEELADVQLRRQKQEAFKIETSNAAASAGISHAEMRELLTAVGSTPGPPGPPGSRRRRRSWPYSWVSMDILLVLAPVDLRHGVPRGLLRRVPFAPAAHDRREQRRHLEHAVDGPRWRRRHASGESSATTPLSVSTRSHAT